MSLPDTGAGPAAAHTLGLAAGVLRAVANEPADGPSDWPDAAGLAAQADALVRRGEQLAEQDIAAYREASSLLGGGTPTGARSAREVIDEAAAVPGLIVEAAGDVAELALVIARDGPTGRRADAAGCAVLAEAAALACGLLVAVNLNARPGDPLRVAAEAAVERVGRTRAAALETLTDDIA